MKLFAFSTAFFLMFLSSMKAQSPDCKKFRDGKFKMESHNGMISYIERKGSKQTETSSNSIGTYHFKVRWLDDCTYTLMPTKKTLKMLFNGNPPKDPLLTVVISEVKENSYIQVSTASFLDGVRLTNEVFRTP